MFECFDSTAPDCAYCSWLWALDGTFVWRFLYFEFGAAELNSTFESTPVLLPCNYRAKFIWVQHSSSATFERSLSLAQECACSPSASTSLIMSSSSWGEGFCPSLLMTTPISSVVMKPLPSWSKSSNASRKSNSKYTRSYFKHSHTQNTWDQLIKQQHKAKIVCKIFCSFYP